MTGRENMSAEETMNKECLTEEGMYIIEQYRDHRDLSKYNKERERIIQLWMDIKNKSD